MNSLLLPESVRIEMEEIQAATLKQPVEWFVDALTGGNRSDAGVSVNGTTILTHGPVWQGVNILAGDFGQVPFSVFRVRDIGGRRFRDEAPARLHPAYMALKRPNSFQTAAVWKETMLQYAIVWGNALSPINRVGRRITLGRPIHPTRVIGYDTITVNGEEEIVYRIRRDDGREMQLFGGNVIHLRGLTNDGIWGHSLVEVAKNVLGHGLALQKHGNAVFRNGGKPSGVLEHPGVLGPEERDNLRRDWQSIHGGAENSGKIAVLWQGMTFRPISMTNEDAQWLEARRFDREMVASLLNLPAFKLNALENSAVRANLEEQNRDYFQTSLRRHFNHLKEECERKLLTERTADTHEFGWDVDRFVAGDLKSRMEAYSVGISGLVLQPNEARAKEGLAPVDGGDQIVNPNTAPTPMDNGTEPPPETDEEPQNSYRELLRDAVERVLRAEKTRVMQSCRASNFVAAVERFYDGEFAKLTERILGPVVRVCADSGLELNAVEELTTRHAGLSCGELINLAGDHTPETLKAATRELVDSWQDRVDWWLEELIT